MSRRVINPNQLQMFMKPSEIRKSLTGSVDFESQHISNPDVDWVEKKTTLLKNDIAESGVLQPVILDHGTKSARMSMPIFSKKPLPDNPVTMGNGHHRLQAALEIERESNPNIHVPVLHTEDDFMGRRGDTPVAYPHVWS